MVSARFSVGLTGGIGSGKTTVANLFAARGAAVIDTDQIAHNLTAPQGKAIATLAEQFGTRFIMPTGALDRAQMREHVFADPAAKARLEAILHPMIRDQCLQQAKQASGAYLLFVVPLLVESASWRHQVSRIAVVDCPESQQIMRVMDRNGWSEAQVRAIMATQASRAERLAAADDVVSNEGDAALLAPQVDHLHGIYCQLAGDA